MTSKTFSDVLPETWKHEAGNPGDDSVRVYFDLRAGKWCREFSSPPLFWCNTHRRECLADGCGNWRGGITLACKVVDLTGLCEISAAP
jgi:hypothetical protein